MSPPLRVQETGNVSKEWGECAGCVLHLWRRHQIILSPFLHQHSPGQSTESRGKGHDPKLPDEPGGKLLSDREHCSLEVHHLLRSYSFLSPGLDCFQFCLQTNFVGPTMGLTNNTDTACTFYKCLHKRCRVTCFIKSPPAFFLISLDIR